MMKLQLVNTLFETGKPEEAQSKKDMILALYNSGTKDIEAIATLTGAKPSYIGSVLHREGLIDNYFDLYTSTAYPMNVYSKYFLGKLGFKNIFVARQSVRNLEEVYGNFEEKQDRAGQHHALEMALVMLDRARWTGKLEEAEIYRRWLVSKLNRPLISDAKANEVAEKSDEKVELKLVA